MHYNVKGSHWYHIGEGKRQEDPKKYAKGAATIGFDPSLYEKSKLWNKLKGKQNELKEKSKSDAELSAKKKKKSEKTSEIAKDTMKKANKVKKDYDSFLGGLRGLFSKKYKENTQNEIERLKKEASKQSRYSKNMDKMSKRYAFSSFKNGVAAKLMDIPIGAVEFGIRTKKRLSDIASAIGSIKIGKKTLGERATSFGNFIKKKLGFKDKKVIKESSKEQTASKEVENSTTDKSNNEMVKKGKYHDLKTNHVGILPGLPGGKNYVSREIKGLNASSSPSKSIKNRERLVGYYRKSKGNKQKWLQGKLRNEKNQKQWKYSIERTVDSVSGAAPIHKDSINAEYKKAYDLAMAKTNSEENKKQRKANEGTPSLKTVTPVSPAFHGPLVDRKKDRRKNIGLDPSTPVESINNYKKAFDLEYVKALKNPSFKTYIYSLSSILTRDTRDPRYIDNKKSITKSSSSAKIKTTKSSTSPNAVDHLRRKTRKRNFKYYKNWQRYRGYEYD